MNIFFLDRDAKKAAISHVDRHVVKMILESGQLLCSAHHVAGSNYSDIPYKKAYQNHPCSKWVRTSLSNYKWLCDLGLELCKEYTYRYGKTHKSQQVIQWCKDHMPNVLDNNLTPVALAMPDEYKSDDPVVSYRNYYNGAKRHLFSWKNRPIPDWIKI